MNVLIFHKEHLRGAMCRKPDAAVSYYDEKYARDYPSCLQYKGTKKRDLSTGL
jgi:hypothetical protein